jgi:hypothetical protein
VGEEVKEWFGVCIDQALLAAWVLQIQQPGVAVRLGSGRHEEFNNYF